MTTEKKRSKAIQSRPKINKQNKNKQILEPGTIPLKKGSKIIVNFKGYLRDPPYTCFGEGTDKVCLTILLSFSKLNSNNTTVNNIKSNSKLQLVKVSLRG
eukprot:TRINITY_DN8164_c0_g1_i2.p1 TRINITY_DN8164_c0_g1~~TRINITY_DN8164_c0_g1_i2.p1  ORF type:complete len:100 (+),score=6.64 TRINITY_DN8164_c0_g1_i2:58-357(+)